MRILLVFLWVVIFATPVLAVGEPVHVFISMKDQSLRVFKGGKVIARSNVSTGKAGYSTPTGIFSILHKRRRHFSNLYGGAPMPFMQRLTWSGIALHGSGSVPRYPASHGCIRLPHGFAKQLYSLTNSGAHVIITRDEVEPELIEHAALFQPVLPLQQTADMDRWLIEHVARSESTTTTKTRDLPLRILITRRTQRQEVLEAQEILVRLGYDLIVDGAIGPGTRGAIRQFEASLGREPTGRFDSDFLVALYAAIGNAMPLNGHIFVRQNFNPVFDAPIIIQNPELPLGAHLLTAMDFDTNASSIKWINVSLTDKSYSPVYTGESPDPAAGAERRPVAETLARLEIPQEVRRRISMMLTHGSSISISDNGISLETTPKGSDFIVLTKR